MASRSEKSSVIDEKKYEVYYQERNLLIRAELEQARSFDKYILTLAGGTFGLSLLLIKHLVPSFEKGTIGILIAVWITFSMSILATLISFLYSQKACSKQREILKIWYMKKEDELTEEDTKNNYAGLTHRLNWISMFFFIVGVVLLVIFSAINLID